MNTDIEQALEAIRMRLAVYERIERYYNGDHDLAFATEKFESTFGSLFREFSLNLCPVICDAIRDKLRVTGFSVESASRAGTDDAARAVWHRNNMRRRAAEVHKEVLKCGDAYISVWPDAAGRASLYPERAGSVTVVYDTEVAGRILFAAKLWTDARKHIRLNLLYPDRVERYISRGAAGGFPKAADLRGVDDGETPAVIANPYGRVPVFHFANNADIGSAGRSELEAAMPIQDGLNKSVLDMLVAMEFAAFRQRWAAGIEVEYDVEGKAVTPFDSGADKLWVAGDPHARFGDFDAAELEQFLKVKDSFRVDIASVTGTPLHYFLQDNSGLPSGEALKKSETRFVAKIRDRQESFGQVWAEAVAFALRIDGLGDASLITEWEDPSPISEREFLENILLKRRIGLPLKQALIEAGYGVADTDVMLGRETNL